MEKITDGQLFESCLKYFGNPFLKTIILRPDGTIDLIYA